MSKTTVHSGSFTVDGVNISKSETIEKSDIHPADSRPSFKTGARTVLNVTCCNIHVAFAGSANVAENVVNIILGDKVARLILDHVLHSLIPSDSEIDGDFIRHIGVECVRLPAFIRHVVCLYSDFYHSTVISARCAHERAVNTTCRCCISELVLTNTP